MTTEEDKALRRRLLDELTQMVGKPPSCGVWSSNKTHDFMGAIKLANQVRLRGNATTNALSKALVVLRRFYE